MKIRLRFSMTAFFCGLLLLLSLANLSGKALAGGDGTLKWRYLTGDGVYSSPAIAADGTIYVGSSDYHIYAVNPDGTLKWKYLTGSVVISSPAIGADGTVYVGSADSYLYALHPDGTLKWRYKPGVGVGSYLALGRDGTIFVTSREDDVTHSLSAINPDGTLKWKYTAWVFVEFSSPAIGVDGTIYVGYYDRYTTLGGVFALKPDGTLKWRYYAMSYVDSSPAIGLDGTIYVGLDNYCLHAINPDGILKWRYQTGGIVASSPAIVPDGTIYVGSADHYLYALNSSSLGLANSPWPMFYHDVKHTGLAVAIPIGVDLLQTGKLNKKGTKFTPTSNFKRGNTVAVQAHVQNKDTLQPVSNAAVSISISPIYGSQIWLLTGTTDSTGQTQVKYPTTKGTNIGNYTARVTNIVPPDRAESWDGVQKIAIDFANLKMTPLGVF